MTRRKRRNHSAEFKVKVALAAIKGDHTLAELSTQFDLHQNQIIDWKNQTAKQWAVYNNQTEIVNLIQKYESKTLK